MRGPSIAPYAWHLSSSWRLRSLFCVATALVVALTLTTNQLLIVVPLVVIELVAAAYAARHHHALWGAPVKLQFQNGQLLLLHSQATANTYATAVMPAQAAWLGRDMLVVSLRSAAEEKRRTRSLFLAADNSNSADRHRLAMLAFAGYQMGRAE